MDFLTRSEIDDLSLLGARCGDVVRVSRGKFERLLYAARELEHVQAELSYLEGRVEADERAHASD
jgi:hypothetical protein